MLTIFFFFFLRKNVFSQVSNMFLTETNVYDMSPSKYHRLDMIKWNGIDGEKGRIGERGVSGLGDEDGTTGFLLEIFLCVSDCLILSSGEWVCDLFCLHFFYHIFLHFSLKFCCLSFDFN